MALTLCQYARITQALGLAGYAEEEVMAAEGISREEWEGLRAALDETIAEALHEEDHPLIEEYESALQEAQVQLQRPLPPLDQEASAWFGFLKAWSDSDDPEFLVHLGLNFFDLQTLNVAWAEKVLGMTPDERSAALSSPAACPELTLTPRRYPTPKDPVGTITTLADSAGPSKLPAAVPAKPDAADTDDSELDDEDKDEPQNPVPVLGELPRR